MIATAHIIVIISSVYTEKLEMKPAEPLLHAGHVIRAVEDLCWLAAERLLMFYSLAHEGKTSWCFEAVRTKTHM